MTTPPSGGHEPPDTPELTAPVAVRRHPPWGLAACALAVVGICAWLALHGRSRPRTAAPAPVAVAAAAVGYADVPITIAALGAAQAWQSVLIRAQVSGRLQRVNVREGAQVHAGDLLAEIDPAPYQALLLQAQGALTRDQAQLELARLTLKRYQQLVAQNSIAVQQVDTQVAAVKQLEGTVQADQGAVDAARVNLAYCRIISPVTGRVGVRLLDAGNLVSATDTGGIISVNQLEPIAVTFSVPEGDFQRLAAASGGFARSLPTEAFSQDTGAPLGEGELTVADNHVDAASGTVQLKARFENHNRELWPGQFVNVRLTLSVLKHALTIPAAAVNRGPAETFAYVIGADHHVSMRPITVRLVQGSHAIISAGLSAGEAVVTDGQMSLKPGSRVNVRQMVEAAGAATAATLAPAAAGSATAAGGSAPAYPLN